MNRRTERRTWWAEQLGGGVERPTGNVWQVRGSAGPGWVTVDGLSVPDEVLETYERSIRAEIQQWEGIAPRDAASGCFAIAAIRESRQEDLWGSATWHT